MENSDRRDSESVDDEQDYVPSEDSQDENNPADDSSEGTEGPLNDIEIEILEDGSDLQAEQLPRLLRLLQRDGLTRLLQVLGDDSGVIDESIDEDDGLLGIFRRRNATRRSQPDPERFPKVPSAIGRDLMSSGVFGAEKSSEHDEQSQPDGMQLGRRLLSREFARGPCVNRRLCRRLIVQEMLPKTKADMIIHYDLPCYSGQFSEDGNFFYSVNKDFRVRMYDTSNPWKWRYYKTVDYPGGQWTLTDASLSPDNKYLAYTSISSVVCLAPTDPHDSGDPYTLDLADRSRNGRSNHEYSFGRSGIWSVRFSGDGRQLVAGAVKGKIIVFDIESRQALHRITGHDPSADVNAVCFADSTSPHILYSGSDDAMVKVWDTRSMGDSRAAGVFLGHIEGVTYIDSKGDGRYVLSNGKDQSMKLWDIRKVMSSSDFKDLQPDRRRLDASFDYRWGNFDDDTWYQDPNDNSVVTFRGHRVLRTLIRCHFSPPGSTNSRYVYSGSADGKVYVWNLDATLAGVVDVYAATKNSRPEMANFNIMSRWEMDDDDGALVWRTCVRDASWHPNAPIIAVSALNGYGSVTGTVTTHSWDDGTDDDEAEPAMGVRLNKKLEKDPSLYGENLDVRRRRAHRYGVH